MPSTEQLQKWKQGLHAKLPIVGGWRRNWAMNALEAHRDDAEVVPLLVESLNVGDKSVAARATAALSDLSQPAAIDALCGLWAKNREPRLGAIIAERGYLATQPLRVRILTALKLGKRFTVDRPEVVPFLISLLNDADTQVQEGAMRLLEQVPTGPAQDALCEQAIQQPQGSAAQLCVRAGKRPSDHERLCLFLFVTRQLDAYFREDYEGQNLWLQYYRSDATVQGHVMEVVRSGDRRCAAIIGTRSKPLAQCTETEIKLALESWLRHDEWSKLFQGCLELPLKYTFPVLPRMRNSKWEPEEADMKSVYRQILADAGDGSLSSVKQPPATSSLFEKWMARGTEAEFANLSEAEIVNRLKSASPADGVTLVAALARKQSLGDASRKVVMGSQHWLVRLAGYAVEIAPTDLTQDLVRDSNYWISELASASGVLDFSPGKATPADLEALAASPAEAWAGRLGAVRKVLRTIITHRITTGQFEPMVVEAAEFAGTFERVTEAEIESAHKKG